MTKVGDSNTPPKMATEEMYHKQLDANMLKFANALASYSASRGDEKVRFKGMMDTHLELIQSSINEIKTKEIHKQGEKLTKDYQLYIHLNSDENFAAVEQDLQTLREYNQI